jgi:hypothetical protein
MLSVKADTLVIQTFISRAEPKNFPETDEIQELVLCCASAEGRSSNLYHYEQLSSSESAASFLTPCQHQLQ